jgi:hypothetical protein
VLHKPAHRAPALGNEALVNRVCRHREVATHFQRELLAVSGSEERVGQRLTRLTARIEIRLFWGLERSSMGQLFVHVRMTIPIVRQPPTLYGLAPAVTERRTGPPPGHRARPQSNATPPPSTQTNRFGRFDLRALALARCLRCYFLRAAVRALCPRRPRWAGDPFWRGRTCSA